MKSLFSNTERKNITVTYKHCYSKIHLEVSLDCEWIFPGDHLKGMCLAVKNSWCLQEKKRGDLAQAAASIHLF